MTHERPNQSWRSNAWSAAIATILAVLLTHLFDVKALNAANQVAIHDQAEDIKILKSIAKENSEARVRMGAELDAFKEANKKDHDEIKTKVGDTFNELQDHERRDRARQTQKRNHP